MEVPVGFKWFVDGLVDGTIGFGGEESAGASFLRRDGSVWTTDKDGLIACLLAAELTAKLGRNPAAVYAGLTERFGAPAYRRIDAPATPEVKAALGRLSPDAVTATTLAGDPIVARLTRAPGNDAPIGGLKVVSTARAGSPRDRPGRRTSPSSTRRASGARSTWAGSWTRRGLSWTPPSDGGARDGPPARDRLRDYPHRVAPRRTVLLSRPPVRCPTMASIRPVPGRLTLESR